MTIRRREKEPEDNGRKLALFAAGLIGADVGWGGARRYKKESRPLLGDRKILILGAGFAGAQAAQELAKFLPGKEDGQVFLVDEHNFLLFTPMLTEVASGQVDPRHIVSPLRRLSPSVTFIQGRVVEVDVERKSVVLRIGSSEEGIPESRRTLEADYLVIALGSVTNYYGLPGLREHSITMKSVGDAATLCNRVLALLERADSEPDPELRRTLLTLVVGGGGFSGVETMAAVNDFVRSAAAHYPRVHKEEIRTIIIHPRDRLLPELSPELARYAQAKLEERGVEMLLNTRIAGAGEDYVEISGGRRIPTRTLIWTGGIEPNPIVSTLDCLRGKHGGLVVDECFAVRDRPGVWALGDCAEIPQSGAGNYAPTAQNAIREGAHLALNIVAELRGKKPRPFRYRPIAELALVGERAGVARIFGFQFSGILAWFLWRTVYLAKMPRLSNRVRIGIDWTLDLLFGHEISEYLDNRSIGQEEKEADRRESKDVPAVR